MAGIEEREEGFGGFKQSGVSPSTSPAEAPTPDATPFGNGAYRERIRLMES